ncbi:hypothetical protein BDF20DRAFT_858299 [Mycotypha africana]|uniref:uncharacterized protein n=1 Tax=Mycotypha africana TaxID=64632 RepID=UPI002301EC31|nr:uncharacterized protein BDF20DRAFT_858299 [Mycotypha africana]KAI8984157.1 hypothetical protein BDF20DRAFT_858299 [Mycotypha africana]
MLECKQDLTDTKSLPIFTIDFNPSFSLKLRQSNETGSHGTTVWDSAKLLAFYLYDTVKKPSFENQRKNSSNSTKNIKTCLELGSGCGLAGLTMASLGYQTVLTDLPDVIHYVLEKNCQDATKDITDWWYYLHHHLTTSSTADLIQPPSIIVEPLDWLKIDVDSTYSQETNVFYNYILASDCIYEVELVEPLLKCIRHYSSTSTIILIAVERRDDAVIDSFIKKAEAFGFNARMVLKKFLRHDMVDNDDVEIWKLKLKRGIK